MADIFKFQGEKLEEEEYCCNACQVTDDYLEIALECEDKDELRVVMRGLYEDAERIGYQSSLRQDIAVKAEILDEMKNSVDDNYLI